MIENLKLIFREYITEWLKLEHPNQNNFNHGGIFFDPVLNKELYFPNLRTL